MLDDFSEKLQNSLYQTCETCNGSGEQTEEYSWHKVNPYKYECLFCKGSGKTISIFGQVLIDFIEENIKLKVVK